MKRKVNCENKVESRKPYFQTARKREKGKGRRKGAKKEQNQTMCRHNLRNREELQKRRLKRKVNCESRIPQRRKERMKRRNEEEEGRETEQLIKEWRAINLDGTKEREKKKRTKKKEEKQEAKTVT